MSKNELKGEVLVDYIKDVLEEHGAFFMEGMPEDEYDCCIEEVGNIIWDICKSKAMEACTGVYSTNGSVLNETYRQAIDRIESPFGTRDA